MQRRKMSGKCPTCGKGFGNWKNFSGRVSVYVHVCNTMYMYIHVCIHVYISILHALVCGNIHLFVFACTCSIMNKVHVHLSISTCTCTWMCISTTIKLNIFSACRHLRVSVVRGVVMLII